MEVSLHKTVNRPVPVSRAAAQPQRNGQPVQTTSNERSTISAGTSASLLLRENNRAGETGNPRTLSARENQIRGNNRNTPLMDRLRENAFHHRTSTVNNPAGSDHATERTEPRTSQNEAIHGSSESVHPEASHSHENADSTTEMHHENGDSQEMHTAASANENTAVHESLHQNAHGVNAFSRVPGTSGSANRNTEPSQNPESRSPETAAAPRETEQLPADHHPVATEQANPVRQAAIFESARIRSDSNASEAKVNSLADARIQSTRDTLDMAGEGTRATLEAGMVLLRSRINSWKDQISGQVNLLLSMVSAGIANLIGMAGVFMESLRIGIINIVMGVSLGMQAAVQQIVNNVLQIVYSIPLPPIPGMDEIRAFMLTALGTAASLLIGAVSFGMSMLQNALMNVFNMLSQLAANLVARLNTLFVMLVATIGRILTRVFNTFDNLLQFLEMAVDFALNRYILPSLLRVATEVYYAIQSSRTHALNLIRINRTAYLLVLSRALQTGNKRRESSSSPAVAIKEIRQLGTDARSNNLMIFKAFELATGGFVGLIRDILQPIISSIRTNILTIVTQVVFMVESVGERIFTFLSLIMNFVLIFMNDILNHLQQVMGRVIAFIFSLSSDISVAVLQFCRRAYSSIRNTIMSVLQSLLEIGGGIVRRIIGAAGIFNTRLSRREMNGSLFREPLNRPFPRLLEKVFSMSQRASTALLTILAVLAPVSFAAIISNAATVMAPVTIILAMLAGIPAVQALIRLFSFLLHPHRDISHQAAGQSTAPTEAGPPIQLVSSEPPASAEIAASPGDRIMFGVEARDLDIRGNDHQLIPGTGPYRTVFNIQGDAEFISRGSRLREISFPHLSVRHLPLLVSATWNNQRIQVRARISDLAGRASESARDQEYSVRWNILPRRIHSALKLRRISGPDGIFAGQYARFVYEVISPESVHQPSLSGQTINEGYERARPVNIEMRDLRTEWKSAHPELNTPERVASELFSEPVQESYPLDNQNRFQQTLSGFGNLDPFLESAFRKPGGIGFNRKLFYTLNGRHMGSALLEKRFSHTRGVEIRKTGS